MPVYSGRPLDLDATRLLLHAATVPETRAKAEVQETLADALAAYCSFEEEHGFYATWIRTDYRFESLSEAEELTRFFFGDALADRVAREGLVILPECTGIW